MRKLEIRDIAAAAFALVALAWQSPASARTPEEERNLQVVIDFYNAMMNEKDVEKTLTFVGDCFTQHSLYAPDGANVLREFTADFKKNYPENRAEIVRAFVDGDTVMLHIHEKRTPEALGWAVIEVMRVKDGKVVEHWDIFQNVVDPAQARNANTMF